MLDCWTAGPLDAFNMIEPVGLQTASILDCWTASILYSWTAEPPRCLNSGQRRLQVMTTAAAGRHVLTTGIIHYPSPHPLSPLCPVPLNAAPVLVPLPLDLSLQPARLTLPASCSDSWNSAARRRWQTQLYLLFTVACSYWTETGSSLHMVSHTCW